MAIGKVITTLPLRISRTFLWLRLATRRPTRAVRMRRSTTPVCGVL